MLREEHQSTKDSGHRVRCKKCRARKIAAPHKDEHGFGLCAVDVFLGSWLSMDCGEDASWPVRHNPCAAQQKAFRSGSVPEATTNRVIPRATCEVDTYSFHAFLLCSPLCHTDGHSRLMSLLLAGTHTDSGESKQLNTQLAGVH